MSDSDKIRSCSSSSRIPSHCIKKWPRANVSFECLRLVGVVRMALDRCLTPVSLLWRLRPRTRKTSCSAMKRKMPHCAAAKFMPFFIILNPNIRLWYFLWPLLHGQETAAEIGQELFQSSLHHVHCSNSVRRLYGRQRWFKLLPRDGFEKLYLLTAVVQLDPERMSECIMEQITEVLASALSTCV